MTMQETAQYNETKMDNTGVCELCKQLFPASEIEYSELYCLNLCKNCKAKLAEEMIACDKELEKKGELVKDEK